VYGTLVISCAPREAIYVLTSILDNDTSIDPEMHTTDTHVPPLPLCQVIKRWQSGSFE